MGDAFKLHRLDHDGIAEILTSPAIAQAIAGLAKAIAEAVAEATGVDVVVDEYETDRAAASVTIRDRSGRTLQVRDGVLTRAAAAQGLEVNENGADDG